MTARSWHWHCQSAVCGAWDVKRLLSPLPLPALPAILPQVTIANIVAGAGFVATLYSLLYGSLGKKISGKSA